MCVRKSPALIFVVLIVFMVSEVTAEKYEHITDCILDTFHPNSVTFICDPSKAPIEFVNQNEISCRFYQPLPNAIVKENGLPKISFRNCHSLQLPMLTQWNRAVQLLDIESVDLKEIKSKDLEYASDLATLDASNNLLAVIPSSLFRYSTKMSKVNFSANKIIAIDPMAFENASNLNSLDLSHNLIEDIDNRTFANLYQLELLTLSYNLIRNIQSGLFDDLNKLKSLMLSNNLIAQLECSVFANLISLEAFHVEENNLQEFNSTCFQSPHDIFLSIDGNQLMSLMLPQKIGNFFASANRLKRINVQRDLQNVFIFNVSQNRIENIPELLNLMGSNLKVLDVSDSPVGALNSSTLAKFSKLAILKLRNTSLSYIANDAFRYQHELSSLDISYNNLKTIDSGIAEWNLRYLQFLHLDGNMLENLNDFSRANFNTLRYLSINNNSFSCGYLTGFLRQLDNEHISTRMPGFLSDGQYNQSDGIACYNESNSAETTASMFNVKLLLSLALLTSYVHGRVYSLHF